jgi:hypothetical protein
MIEAVKSLWIFVHINPLKEWRELCQDLPKSVVASGSSPLVL